jgi:hypothetical protein
MGMGRLAAQQVIHWDELQEVSYQEGKGKDKSFDWGKPTFGDSLQLLDGKYIRIKGYMLPITVDQKKFILSRYHFSECFFCGNGGPETVIELKLKQPVKKVIIDHPVDFVGTLRLNRKAYELVFVLEEAEMKK